MRWTMAAVLLLVGACGKKGGAEPPVPAPDPQVEPAPAPEPGGDPAPAPAPEPGGGQAEATCGGIAALQCPSGFTCVDDPGDTCDPAQGGRDCSGRCVACDAPELNRRTVSDDPDLCARMRFTCAPGEEAWFDACGCGCVEKD